MNTLTRENVIDILNRCAGFIGQSAYVDSEHIIQQAPQYEKLPMLVHELVEAAEGRTFTIEQIGDIAAEAVSGFWMKHQDMQRFAESRDTIQKLLAELQKVAFKQKHPMQTRILE